MSFGIYDNVLAAAINRYKFYGIKRLHRPLGKFLLEFQIPEIDAIVPVPLSIKGLRDRGFNQALLISKIVSDHFKTPMIIDGLIKHKDTHAQIGLSAKERAANLKGVFITRRDFKGMRLMLIDDVMTTGATANECSKQLLKAGAKEVVVMTLARAGAC
jgi:ComF family protein